MKQNPKTCKDCAYYKYYALANEYGCWFKEPMPEDVLPPAVKVLVFDIEHAPIPAFTKGEVLFTEKECKFFKLNDSN